MENLTNERAKQITDQVFQIIESANNDEELKLSYDREIGANIMKEDLYPEIKFEIDSTDIENLQKEKYLNSDGTLNHQSNEFIKDPLTKLLYSLAWKNGDLKKIKHIVNGIKNANESAEDSTQDEALVFYQFGKHLADRSREPIIDQHVLRAFALKESNKQEEYNKIRKMHTITHRNKELVFSYKAWIQNLEAPKAIENYRTKIDKILFALGKTIKLK